jgi:hypothetical protein
LKNLFLNISLYLTEIPPNVFFSSFPNSLSFLFLLSKLFIKKGYIKSFYPRTRYRTDPRSIELSLAEPERELGRAQHDPAKAGESVSSGTAGWDSGPSILFLNSLIDLLSFP